MANSAPSRKNGRKAKLRIVAAFPAMVVVAPGGGGQGKL